MKKLWIGAVLGLLFLGSCADKKANREEFKNDNDGSAMRNEMGDSAVANSEYAPSDTMKVKKDSVKTK